MISSNLQYQKLTEELTDWLIKSEIRTSNAGILSWLSPEKNGYFYPEVTGYFLKLLLYLYLQSWNREYLKQSEAVLECLQQELLKTNGKICRDDFCYAFDTGIILRALLRYHFINNTQIPLPILKPALEFLWECFKQKKAGIYVNGETKNDIHWSKIYYPHLLKILPLLLKFPELKNDSPLIAEEMIADFKDSIFDEPIYAHAFCYGLEGFLWLKDRGYSQTEKILKKGADILALLQQDDGGIINNTDSSRQVFPVSDATSQAARLWLILDPGRYKAQIKRALNFLTQAKAPGGGILYHPESQDQNSWCTIFAIQAFLFYLGEPKSEHLI